MTETTTAPATWTVGKAARAAGLSAKAVRLYEAKGLLPEAPRTESGYRTYTDDDITVLRFIRQAKTLGLSLGEIRDILDLRRGGTTPCRARRRPAQPAHPRYRPRHHRTSPAPARPGRDPRLRQAASGGSRRWRLRDHRARAPADGAGRR